MPIKIPDQLPATNILESENIFVMTEHRALTQDIRPLQVLLLNLMPTKIATETQLSRLLSNTSLQVELNTGDLAVSDLDIETVLVDLNTGRAEISGVKMKSIVAHSDTGDLLLSDLTPVLAELSVNTGDIRLTNVVCSGDLRCESSTGDIKLTDVDGENLYLKASTGDITGTILTEKVFTANCSTGKVSVPATTSGGRCEAETSTGNITLSYSGR